MVSLLDSEAGSNSKLKDVWVFVPEGTVGEGTRSQTETLRFVR